MKTFASFVASLAAFAAGSAWGIAQTVVPDVHVFGPPYAVADRPFPVQVDVVRAPGNTVGYGTIRFAFDGQTVAGCEALPTYPVPTCTYPATSAGVHRIDAFYSGGFDVQPGSNGYDVTVHAEPAPTSVVVTPTGTSYFGSPIVLQARVNINATLDRTPGFVGGTVTFVMDGGPLPGCEAVTPSLGSANCPVTEIGRLAPLGHTITVLFNGDAMYAPSTGFSTHTVRAMRRAAMDFNGDGNADLLWQNGAGRTAQWLMNDAGQAGGRELFGAGTGWTPVLVGDFNGDRAADIVFTHADGRVAMWLMQGDTQIGGAMLLGAGTGWVPKFAADFDGDGKADILWRHADGRVATWHMDGTAHVGGAGLLDAGTGWTPKAIGDFNNDGRADILWEHADQSSALWLMNGTQQVGGGRLFGAGTGWTSWGVADLNGDSRDDILWTHTDGRVAVWFMLGAAQIGGGILKPAATATLLGVADFNRDGRADLVWRGADGSVSLALMDGLTVLPGGGTILPGPTGFSYTFNRFASNAVYLGEFIATHTDGSVVRARYDGTSFTTSTLLPAGTGYAVVAVPQGTSGQR